MPIDILEENAEHFKLHPIGCGPFRLVRHDEEMVRLDVFTNYYGDRPWLDRVEIIKIPSSFHTRQTHPLLLKSPDASWKEVRVKEEGADYITFNCRKEWSNERRAISSVKFVISIDPSNFCLQVGNKEVAHSFLTERSMELKQRDRLQQEESIPTEEFVLKIAAQQIRKDANHEERGSNPTSTTCETWNRINRGAH